MTITVAATRRNGEWRAASIVDNEFQDVTIDAALANVLGDSLGVVLAQEYPDGAKITVNVSVTLPAESA